MIALHFTCFERSTTNSVNGPQTKVTLIPSGAINTSMGSITFFLHDKKDLEDFQVGRSFMIKPEPA